MTNQLRVGMGQPYAVRCTVAASADFLPGLPTGASFVVTKPDGSVVTWVAEIDSQTVDAIAVLYALAAVPPGELGDLDVAGVWRAWVQFTIAGEAPGPRGEPFSFTVKPPALP